MATRPGQVWSWDITKRRGPQRGVYYDLYVILDTWSRYVIGWTVAAREDAQIAKKPLRRQLPCTAPQAACTPTAAHHDLQAHRAALGRPRRRPQPQPTARQQRLR